MKAKRAQFGLQRRFAAEEIFEDQFGFAPGLPVEAIFDFWRIDLSLNEIGFLELL